jgi:hypothetical protein
MDKEAVILSLVVAGELEIDGLGRIWRLMKRGGRPDRGSFATRPCPRVRAEYRQRQGYLLIATTINGIKTVTGAHRVVWAYFHGPIPAGLTINHKDGVKDCNFPENLELMTYSQQRVHALTVLNVSRHRPIGSLHPKTKLLESDVLLIRQLREGGATAKQIAEDYGMKNRAISAICTRRTWRHI